jgi:hypothetical protein
MLSELSTHRLLNEIVFCLLFVSVGVGLIVSTKNGWNILLDPPEPWRTWKSRSLLTELLQLLGKRGEEYFFYFMGGVFILVGSILIAERMIVLAHRLGY